MTAHVCSTYTGGMSMSVAEIEQAMLALDRRDLAAVVHRGIQALNNGDVNEPQEEIDAAWRDELSKRIDDIRTGKAETIPAEDVFTHIRAKLAARRQ